ncbi:uncharacterized protein JCM15063_004301 [Sporobolomyces koalae]|uniref:uncharacterized protein n=1 Tax=Sporobolomyces koalae TaxID=500713 RepID=UPI00317760E5
MLSDQIISTPAYRIALQHPTHLDPDERRQCEMTSLKAKQDQIRQQLNLKNLQRHDALISEIVTSASYASVYENFGEQWVKTGVEGPMFLFSRSQAPHYGFFVLNRQGLEYIQEFLTPDCELNVGGEFILFESGQNVDKATGIWIFDETERASLCKRMEQLRSAAISVAESTSAATVDPAPSQSATKTGTVPPTTQSISLDDLFASTKIQSVGVNSPADRIPSSSGARPQSSTNPLDALFLDAAARSSPQLQPRQPPTLPQVPANPPSAIPKTLEQLFAAASPVPQSATLPFQALSQAHLSAPSPSMLPNTLPKNSTGPSRSTAQTAGISTGLSLLDSIFASVSGSVSRILRSPSSHLVTDTDWNAHFTFGSFMCQTIAPTPTALDKSAVLTRETAPVSPEQPATSSDSSMDKDARALLAMIGHPAGIDTASTPPSHPPSQLPTNENAVSGPTGPSPRLAPGTNGLATQRSESPRQAPNSSRPDEKKPMFTAPLLSHDVFANFPLPSQKAKPQTARNAERSPTRSSVPSRDADEENGSEREESELNSAFHKAEESIADILRSAPAPLPSIAPTQTALEEAKRPVEAVTSPNARAKDVTSPERSNMPSRAELINLVDETVAPHGKKAHTDGVLAQEEFMQQLFQLLQKPSVQMQLYGRYLGRVEEDND